MYQACRSDGGGAGLTAEGSRERGGFFARGGVPVAEDMSGARAGDNNSVVQNRTMRRRQLSEGQRQ